MIKRNYYNYYSLALSDSHTKSKNWNSYQLAGPQYFVSFTFTFSQKSQSKQKRG